MPRRWVAAGDLLLCAALVVVAVVSAASAHWPQAVAAAVLSLAWAAAARHRLQHRRRPGQAGAPAVPVAAEEPAPRTAA
ncbi:hypothetical protein [Kineococcus sp. SYSU DK006]|uniref:hypothetical protein n=1 Tax=Kineococcus sp. SYSU DK006 TaxID=3383127 RepID=UPI003D7E2271